MTSSFGKALIVIVLLASIAGVLAWKSRQPGVPAPPATRDTAVPPRQESPAVMTAESPARATAPVSPAPAVRQAKRAESAPTDSPPPRTKPATPGARALPRLLELGADKCVPCKMMQPVLAALRQDYPGRLQVDFIDVWKDESVGQRYGIQAIPTQIFFDAQGKEIFRHTGFYPREEILAKFKELGIAL